MRIIGEAAALRGADDEVTPPAELGRYRAVPPARRLAIGQDPGEIAQGVLMLAVADAGEVAGELEQHALLRHQLAGLRLAAPLGLDVLEEVADLDPQRLGDLVEPAGRDAVDAGLVLVRLLVGDADQLGHLLLGQAEHDPALADAQADIVVDVEGPAATAAGPPGGLVRPAGSPKRSTPSSRGTAFTSPRRQPITHNWLKYRWIF